MKENGFSDQRLTDAVNNVIDTCIYPTPTVANFISFDKRVKTYKYPEICEMLNEDIRAFDHYKPIKFRDLPDRVWIHINDIAKYGIKNEDNTK